MKTILYSLALGSLMIAVSGMPVLAVENTPAGVAQPPKQVQPPKQPPVKVSPTLTRGECTQLGGHLAQEANCVSGVTCITTDQNGVLRQSCTDKVQ
jgi:hypothetical protein